MDYIAIAGGPIAILAGLTGIVAGLKGSNKLTRVGVPLTAVLLGIYQLLRGFGLT